MALSNNSEFKSNRSDNLQKLQSLLTANRSATITKSRKPQKDRVLAIEEMSVRALRKDFKSFFRDMNPLAELDYHSFLELMKKLQFVKEVPKNSKYLEEKALIEKAWKLISTGNQTSRQNVLLFLESIINPNAGCEDCLRPSTSIMSMGRIINKEFVANKSESMRIHKYFWILGVNRNIGQSICTEEKVKMEETHKNRSPKVNRNIALYELSKAKKKENGPTTEEILLNNCLSECTFHPKIIKPSGSTSFRECVERLSKPKRVPVPLCKNNTKEKNNCTVNDLRNTKYFSPLKVAKALVKQDRNTSHIR